MSATVANRTQESRLKQEPRRGTQKREDYRRQEKVKEK
jgi:hypothetical protein